MLAVLLAIGLAWADPENPEPSHPPEPAEAPADEVVVPPPLPVVPVGIAMGLPIIEGDLSIEGLLPPFEEALPRMKGCFGDYGGEWEGEVLVRLVINPNGTVREAAVATTTLQAPDIETCLQKAAASATYASRDEKSPATVVLPLNFYPE